MSEAHSYLPRYPHSYLPRHPQTFVPRVELSRLSWSHHSFTLVDPKTGRCLRSPFDIAPSAITEHEDFTPDTVVLLAENQLATVLTPKQKKSRHLIPTYRPIELVDAEKPFWGLQEIIQRPDFPCDKYFEMSNPHQRIYHTLSGRQVEWYWVSFQVVLYDQGKPLTSDQLLSSSTLLVDKLP